MEFFFGAVAWDYSGTFMNIDGRVNLMFALIWGVLGFAWVRVVMPAIKHGFGFVDWKSLSMQASTALLTAFLAVNIIVTVQAFDNGFVFILDAFKRTYYSYQLKRACNRKVID